jgi:4'-phosphopantetheinyl transferase
MRRFQLTDDHDSQKKINLVEIIMPVVSNKNNISRISGSEEISHNHTGVVEVYFAKTRDILPEYSRLMSFINIRDKLKAEKLSIEEDRYTSLICHSLLRLILSRKLNTDHASLEILNEGRNKPRLKGNSIFFNISHTRDSFVFAISERSEIGIDLEKVDRNIDFMSIAKKFFSNDEYAFILKKPEDSRNRFFLLWTRKEAVLKAMGTGIISSLSHVEVMEKNSIINGKPQRIMTGNGDYDHFIYSRKISRYYLSIAVHEKSTIVLHKLNVQKVQSFYD